MRKILGLVIVVILVMGYGMQDAGYQIQEEIVIIKGPRITQINPYQIEYEQMLYPTVRITAGFSTGSGVIFETTDAHRLTQIITAAHVVGDETTVNIELYNAETVTGTVVITDIIKDIALIKAEINIDFKIYKARLAPESYQAYLFTPIYTVGCALGLLPRPSQGIISAINADSWEVSSPILPGNSGGPVYDARTYEVIGIAVWVKTYQGQLVTTMAGIVTIQEIHDFINHR